MTNPFLPPFGIAALAIPSLDGTWPPFEMAPGWQPSGDHVPSDCRLLGNYLEEARARIERDNRVEDQVKQMIIDAGGTPK